MADESTSSHPKVKTVCHQANLFYSKWKATKPTDLELKR